MNGKPQWRQNVRQVVRFFWCLVLILALCLTVSCVCIWRLGSLEVKLLFPVMWTVFIQSYLGRGVIRSGFYLHCFIAGSFIFIGGEKWETLSQKVYNPARNYSGYLSEYCIEFISHYWRNSHLWKKVLLVLGIFSEACIGKYQMNMITCAEFFFSVSCSCEIECCRYIINDYWTNQCSVFQKLVLSMNFCPYAK